MANKKIKGITIEIGGDTSKLGDALKDSEKHTRDLQGELRQVERLLQFDPGNTELLAQKQKILADIIGETTNKLNTLRDAQSQVEDQFKNGDIGEDQYRAFQRELIKTENELKELESGAKGAKDDVQDLGDTAEQSGDGFTIMGGALADLVASAIKGAISAIGDLVGSLLELSEATEEYRTMQAKLEGSSETFGYSMDFASEKYKDFYKYLGDDQMATNAITNLMGLGTSTENVSALAEGAIGVWTAYGDSIPIEGLTEALNETAQVGKVTGSLADALNWAGISEDEFNKKLEKCSTTQERADLIAKTLNDTYGTSKEKYDELSGSILDANEAELKLKDTQAQLGQAVEPVNTAMTNLKNQALEMIAPLVEKLAGAFSKLLNWLNETPGAFEVVTGLVVALATSFTILAGALAIQGIIAGVTKAIAFLNTTLLANPIVLIVALIAGLVAGFIYLWNTCEPFKQFFIDLWEGIKTATSTAIDAIVNFFTVTIPNACNSFITFFQELPYKIGYIIGQMLGHIIQFGIDIVNFARTKIPEFVNNAINFFKQLPSKIKSAISSAITVIGSWGSSMLSKAKTAVSSVVTGVVNGFKDLPTKIKSIGSDLVKGLWNGIGNTKQWILDKIKSFGKGILDGLKSFFGIKSPSRVMRDEIGKYISEGIGVGIEENADNPIEALETLGDDMVNTTKDINGITLNRQLENTFSGTLNAGGSIGDLIAVMETYLPRLIEVSQHDIRLDDDTLVGKTIKKIDQGLATNYSMKARGI